MPAFLCLACGTQFTPGAKPPDRCPICEDDRQPVRREGQAWTTLDELRSGHQNEIREVEPGLFGIGTIPRFAIGQRALLIQTGRGNLLWDCISVLDANVLPGRDARVSFMRSYPMLLPLPERLLDGLLAAVEDVEYDRIYGAWWESVIESNAKEVVRASADLYRTWLRGSPNRPS